MAANTKDRILRTALQLYNNQGVYNPHGEQVTARHIARELNMSDGNLRYHYSTREELLRGLYDQLVGRLQPWLEPLPASDHVLRTWFRCVLQQYEALFQYRFFLRDFTGIMQHMPELRIHYRFLQQTRRRQFRQVITELDRQGWLLPEPLPGQWDRLFDQWQIQADFWYPSSELHYHGADADRCRHYARLAASMVVPYLSASGLAAWQSALEDNF